MKNTKTSIYFFPAILAVLFTSSILIIFFSFNSQTTIPIQTPTPTPIVETSTWETYKNDQYGFEFKYPSNWIKEREGLYSVDYNSPETHNNKRILGTDLIVSFGYIPNIDSFLPVPTGVYKNLQDYFSKNVSFPEGLREIIYIGQISVNGYIGYKVINGGHYDNFEVLFENDKGIYSLSFQSASDESHLTSVQKQILSTFKFTANNSDTISSDKAIDIVNNLSEVISMNKFLSSKGTKSVIYVEVQPTANNPNYQVYYGESLDDHNSRIASFMINSQNGEVKVNDLISGQIVDYLQWQSACQSDSKIYACF